MTEKLPDVWTSRDYPVLLAIAAAVDLDEWIGLHQISERTGMAQDEVFRAIRSLEANGYLVEVSYSSGPDAHVGNITTAAYRVTGLHPDPAEAVASLTHLLEQAAAWTTDPTEKSKLQRAAGAVGELVGTAAGTFLAAYAAKMTGVG
jgi:hypothetical protein